jgi:hypothetical protein
MTNVLFTQPTRIRIAGMCGLIKGVRTAFTNIPRALQDAELPAFVIFNGPATYDNQSLGEQLVQETRVYQLMLFIQNAAFGSTGELQEQSDYFFEAVRDYFLARPGLELDTDPNPMIPSAFDAELLGDGGYSIGPYPLNAGGEGTPSYVQIRWQLSVVETAQVNYAD